MQSGYELVRNAIEFKSPERVPYNFDSNRTPEINMKYGDDLVWVFVGNDPDFVPSTPGADESGIIVDIQTTLCKPGNFRAIDEKTRQLIWHFGRYNGGFMAKTYPQPESIQIPEENIAFMCEQFKRYGRYPLSFNL